MIYLELLIGFFKVGCFSFGGSYGAIPLIRDVVMTYGWLSDESLAYMIAVSESTPGPIMVNMATYVGSSQAGFWGAVVATLAVVLPSFAVTLLVMAALKTALSNKYVQAVLGGLNPSIMGIIFSTGLFMIITRLFNNDTGIKIDVKALIVTILLLISMFASKRFFKKQISPIGLIVISAVLGMVLL